MFNTDLTDYRIRPAVASDIPTVCALDHEAFLPYGTAELAEVFIVRFEVFPKGFLVLESQNTLLGYGTSEKWQALREPAMNEDPRATHSPTGQVFCISAMAVKPGYWGRKLGSAILTRLVAVAREDNCSNVVLETTHAEGFYLRHGFSTIGERAQMGTTLKIMSLSLERINKS